MSASEQIALFPLNTVLFPGGLLPLRIFEPRYLDMVGRCLRSDSVFGVVLLDAGSDTSREVSTASVGTSARIVDFQQLEDGLLGLLCRGERRFRISAHTRNDDGLNCAQVEWLDDTRLVPVPAQFQALVSVLRWPNCCRWIKTPYSVCSSSTIRKRGWACSRRYWMRARAAAQAERPEALSSTASDCSSQITSVSSVPSARSVVRR